MGVGCFKKKEGEKKECCQTKKKQNGTTFIYKSLFQVSYQHVLSARRYISLPDVSGSFPDVASLPNVPALPDMTSLLEAALVTLGSGGVLLLGNELAEDSGGRLVVLEALVR